MLCWDRFGFVASGSVRPCWFEFSPAGLDSVLFGSVLRDTVGLGWFGFKAEMALWSKAGERDETRQIEWYETECPLPIARRVLVEHPLLPDANTAAGGRGALGDDCRTTGGFITLYRFYHFTQLRRL